jgi:hypothetical protein
MSQKFPYVKLEDVALDRPSEDGVIPVKVINPAALVGTYLTKVEGEDASLAGTVATRHCLKEGDILTPSRGVFRASLLEKEPELLSGGLQLVAGPLCHVVRVDAEKADQFVCTRATHWRKSTSRFRPSICSESWPAPPAMPRR